LARVENPVTKLFEVASEAVPGQIIND